MNDNLGNLLALHFSTPVGGNNVLSPVVFRNTAGVLIAIEYAGGNNDNIYNDDVTNPTLIQNFVQVGTGLTPATRQDFKTEAPFTNGGAEDNPTQSNPNGYDSGLAKITIGTLISPTGGSGTITEVTMVQETRQGVLMWFRDILSTPVGFIIGKNINIDYEVLI